MATWRAGCEVWGAALIGAAAALLIGAVPVVMLIGKARRGPERSADA